MRPYETLVVLRTDLGEEAAKLLTRFQSIIETEGGAMDENRDWGIRDLAYPIAKQKQGHFHLMEYHAEPHVVKELERNLRIIEGVLRFVSVQQEHTGLPEPRVRENYDRRDTPLSEMRSGGRDDRPAPPKAAAPAPSEAPAEPAAEATPAAPAEAAASASEVQAAAPAVETAEKAEVASDPAEVQS